MFELTFMSGRLRICVTNDLLNERNQIRPSFRIDFHQAVRLAKQIEQVFNREELGRLIASLDFNIENVSGKTHAEISYQSVLYVQRRNRLPELLKRLSEERTFIDWYAIVSSD